MRTRNAFVPQAEYPLVIDGSKVTTAERFETIDPSVGRVRARLAQASADHADEAVAAARRALAEWRATGPAERQALLGRIADRVEQDEAWPSLLATENGRPIREAQMADVPTASELAAASVVEFGLRTADLIPPGVVNILTGYGPEVGAALVGHPGVDKISFTGGVPTARRILHAAADNITPSLMELGGKSAFVICADADLDLAVADAVMGIAFQNGQVCFAASRLFLHARIRDAFLERFLDTLRRIRIGDAPDSATQVGPLVSAEHRDRVMGHIERAVAEGAVLLAGGGRPEMPDELAEGFYAEPAVIDDPQGRTPVSREEVFGPVVTVQTWTDEADVLRRANASEFGLAAGVWTRDLVRAHRFASALEAGTVWVNTWFDVSPGQPLGGLKDSGFGRELSAETLLEYTAPKAVAMRLSAQRPALWG